MKVWDCGGRSFLTALGFQGRVLALTGVLIETVFLSYFERISRDKNNVSSAKSIGK